jgi:hypothetical protein
MTPETNFKLVINSKNSILKTFKIICLIGSFFWIDFPAFAQINLATLMDIVGDQNAVFIEDKVAQVQEQATLGQAIRTEQARAQIDFNTGATGRMAENSQITVGQCLDVQEGVLIASGPANGCILSFSTGVQGTIYVLNVERNNNTNINSGTIRVLEGQIQLSLRDNQNDPNIITIREGQKVSSLRSGLTLSQIALEQISKQEYEEIITGPLFKGYKTPLPNQDKLNDVCKRLYGNCRPVGGDSPVRGLW